MFIRFADGNPNLSTSKICCNDYFTLVISIGGYTVYKYHCTTINSNLPSIVTVKSIIEVFALISGEYGGFGNLVVMYNINPFNTSHSLSPTITFSIEPDLMKFFSKTLSRTGSNSTSISSISKGFPTIKWSIKVWIQFVSCTLGKFKIINIIILQLPKKIQTTKYLKQRYDLAELGLFWP